MIEIKNLSKTFKGQGGDVKALNNVNITIETGDIYGIIGMSGAGKSTLVRCINMLERPTEGTVLIDGTDIGKMSEKELREVRRNVTMIFQSFNLLMQRTCLKNIMFPLELARVPKEEAKKKALELLEVVGLPDKANAYPAQLSGGQQQRIAIARALATNPKVLLCDEATSALDPKTTRSVLELIKEINEKFGITVIVITHQMSVVEEICNKVSILDHGNVVETGNVSDVFTRPKSNEARRLVFPDGITESLPLKEGEHHIRLVFTGDGATNRPLIARLSHDIGIEANILSANTKTIEGRNYGNMLLGITGDDEVIKKAIDYIQHDGDIVAEEVTGNVR